MILPPANDDKILKELNIYKNFDFLNFTYNTPFPEFKNIDSLYHFTPCINLFQIGENGLYSRDQFENKLAFYNNMFGFCTDKNRYDYRKNFISLSINKPYFDLLKIKRRSTKKMGGICILKISKEILNAANDVLFCPKNAATKSVLNTTDENLRNINNIYKNNDEINQSSEILIADHIPITFIEAVYFSPLDRRSYNITQFHRFLNQSKYHKLWQSIPFLIDHNKFCKQ